MLFCDAISVLIQFPDCGRPSAYRVATAAPPGRAASAWWAATTRCRAWTKSTPASGSARSSTPCTPCGPWDDSERHIEVRSRIRPNTRQMLALCGKPCRSRRENKELCRSGSKVDFCGLGLIRDSPTIPCLSFSLDARLSTRWGFGFRSSLAFRA